MTEGGWCSPNPAFGFFLYGQVGEEGGFLACFPIPSAVQVRVQSVAPAILELLKGTSAALGESGVAYLVFVHQHLTAGVGHCLPYLFGRCTGDALVALAMVIGTDVKAGVGIAFVPYKPSAFFALFLRILTNAPQ